jgi:acetylornithine deacetylase/succinyl-diaminopimelate desuccinylase-like protein
MPGEDLAASAQEVRAIAEEAIKAVPGAAVEVLTERAIPAVMSRPDAPHVQAMVNANRYLDLDTELTGFNMGSDGRFFAAAGYPTIIYGPGDPRIAHIRDEWVGIEEVMTATRAYALAALELLGI